jgi:hypothetical protein
MDHIREKMGLVERNGPFLAKLWEKETSQYRVGDFVEPAFPARNWYVLNNVIADTPQLIRISTDRNSTAHVREEDFHWQGNVAYCSQGKLDIGSGRNFDRDQIQFNDPELIEEATGIFRQSPSSACRGRADVKMKTVRHYIDRPEIDAVLGAMSDIGAQGFEVLTVVDIGPRELRTSEAAND